MSAKWKGDYAVRFGDSKSDSIGFDWTTDGERILICTNTDTFRSDLEMSHKEAEKLHGLLGKVLKYTTQLHRK